MIRFPVVGKSLLRSTMLTLVAMAGIAIAQVSPALPAPPITLSGLLEEMVDQAALARLPSPAYTQMQASSYNRASTRRDQPGWFADSDGTGFIREEVHNLGSGQTRREWVAMEYQGPGCLTRMWAPFFYYDFNDRTGPIVRIYLDDSQTPAIEARWIELLTNNQWPASYGPAPAPTNAFHIPSPLARFTARAGDVYLPIPFSRSCRVTFDKPPFYNIINWRAYEPGTAVTTFSLDQLKTQAAAIQTCAARLAPAANPVAPAAPLPVIEAHRTRIEKLPAGPGAIRELLLRLDPAEVARDPSILRSLILTMTFDDEETAWVPVGDCFGSPNAINPFTTLAREVTSEGVMKIRWVMPWAKSAEISLRNLGSSAVHADVQVSTSSWAWDDRSMHFHASWRPDDIQPGDKFSDWNFIDVRGQGVLVGDQWTVLNPTDGWWGEGDEKIYVDASYDKGFPDHFGTGTEDYYGWAGGVNPTWADAFSHPWLANIVVGSGRGPGDATRGPGSTRGFNICSRTRGLDAVPFKSRLVFDMEASPGTDQRRATDLLGYSSVVFWYARPGATSNRPPSPQPMGELMSLEALKARSLGR